MKLNKKKGEDMINFYVNIENITKVNNDDNIKTTKKTSLKRLNKR